MVDSLPASQTSEEIQEARCLWYCLLGNGSERKGREKAGEGEQG